MTTEVAPTSTGSLVGYVRVSTDHQTHAAQRDALAALDCARVFEDTMTGTRDDRPGYVALLEYLRPGDVVVVTSLDRLGRSLSAIIRTVEELATRGIYVRSLRESIDTSTTTGRMLAGIFGALAQYERELMLERAAAARAAAARRGVTGGAPRALSASQVADVIEWRRSLGWSAAKIAGRLGVSRRTVYRALESAQNAPEPA